LYLHLWRRRAKTPGEKKRGGGAVFNVKKGGETIPLHLIGRGVKAYQKEKGAKSSSR